MPTKRAVSGFHTCPNPACRKPGVPNSMFACHPCWLVLPGEVRILIYSTAHLNLLTAERRAAFDAARSAWKAREDG